jgi:hypothetical protein
MEIFQPLAMKTKNDCGVTALLQIAKAKGLDVGYEEVKSATGFQGYNLQDTPGNLMAGLDKLGIDYIPVQQPLDDDILRMLDKDFLVIFLKKYDPLTYHWTVFYRVQMFGGTTMYFESLGNGMGYELWNDTKRTQPRGWVDRLMKTENLLILIPNTPLEKSPEEKALIRWHKDLANFCTGLVKANVGKIFG